MDPIPLILLITKTITLNTSPNIPLVSYFQLSKTLHWTIPYIRISFLSHSPQFFTVTKKLCLFCERVNYQYNLPPPTHTHKQFYIQYDYFTKQKKHKAEQWWDDEAVTPEASSTNIRHNTTIGSRNKADPKKKCANESRLCGTRLGFEHETSQFGKEQLCVELVSVLLG